MKYFTDELWTSINSESQEEREIASLKWEKNAEEYSKIFQSVKLLLPKKFVEIFYKEYSFHDYNLKSYEIIHGQKGYKDPIIVNLVITDKIKTWNIIYEKIKKIEVTYSQKLAPKYRNKIFYRGFDDYGYNEIFQIDDKTFSHEILFASGATILIHFEKIKIFRIRI